MGTRVRQRHSNASGILLGVVCGWASVAGTAHADTLVDGTWSSLSSGVAAPSGRREYAAFYDRNNQRYIIFAGLAGDWGNGFYLLNETWVLTLGGEPSWSLLDVNGPRPGQRASPQWGYDPTRNRILIFGGYGSHRPGDPPAYLDDVWELRLDVPAAWHEIHPIGTPPAGRLAGTAVYDVFRQRFVGFGGTRGLPVDTWQLDLAHQNAWSTVETDGVQPPGSYGMTSIFDSARNRMVVFGGSTSDAYYGTHNDTWELSLTPERPVWRKLNPAGPLPIARRSGASVFDPLRDRMVIFGGWDGTSNDPSSFLNDTWALSFEVGDGAWTQLSPAGPVPAIRDAMSAIYDPTGDRMVVFGGWSVTFMLADTQFLTWGGAGQTASVVPTAQGDPGVARLEFRTQSTTGPIGGLYRRQAATEWTSLGSVEADASGIVQFDDHDVTDGGVYGYKVVLASEVGEEFIGEVWVEVPAPTDDEGLKMTFSLGSGPNPVVGPIGVSFALPSSHPARLEMIDGRGRRLFVRDVGSLGAGQHQLAIGDARDFASGVYFLRLSQLDRSATRRVVLVHAP